MTAQFKIYKISKEILTKILRIDKTAFPNHSLKNRRFTGGFSGMVGKIEKM